jgi:hypothetical protein
MLYPGIGQSIHGMYGTGIEEAKAVLTQAKDEYSMYYDRRHEPAPVFAPEDKVWLDGSNITTNRPSSKLSH